MSKKIRTEAVDRLFDAILSLENREECYTFFEDICTVNELLSLSQRFEVAKMLREQRTYLEIAEKTGASTATISRVNRSLNYGNDGYDLVLNREIKGFCPTPELLRYQNAYSVGRVALRKYKDGKYTTDEALRVEYLRKPQAEREREERLGGKNG